MKAIKTHNASQNIDAYDQCMIKIVHSSQLWKNQFKEKKILSQKQKKMDE